MQHGRRSEVLKSKKQEISGDALASRLSRMSFISCKAETVSNVVVLHGEIEVFAYQQLSKGPVTYLFCHLL